MIQRVALCLLCAVALRASELAGFDYVGRIVGMIYSGEEIAIRTNPGVYTRNWARFVSISTASTSSVNRSSSATTWTGTFDLEPRQPVRFRQAITPTEDGWLGIDFDFNADADLNSEAAAFGFDLPYARFEGGRIEYAEGSAALPTGRPSAGEFHRSRTQRLRFVARDESVSFTLELDEPMAFWVRDDGAGASRVFGLRLEMRRGLIARGTTLPLRMRVRVDGIPDTRPVTAVIDSAARRYKFLGFGGNYCFGIESPVTQYTLDNLRVATARTEMTLTEWEPRNDNDSATDTDWGYLMSQDRPGSNLRREFLLARQIQDRGIPYSITIWRLPEFLYTDPGQRGPSDQRRRVDPSKWDELLESIGTYLLYARDAYGVEPDLFSFNEANIGVYVLFTPDEHADAIKRIGSHLESLGLKTRMLLADATGPRGTHTYALPAASDPNAMRYVGAVGFHSWGGATPAEYRAWADLAESLGLPLHVTEVGADAAAWRNGMYNSLHYGLREVRMYQELLLHARPRSTMQWELTNDYGPLSGSLEPTHRYWFFRQFNNLTPLRSDALAVSSDHPDVPVTAFEGADGFAVHVANLGAAREVTVRGLRSAISSLRAVITGEGHEFTEAGDIPVHGGEVRFPAPSRALITLTTMRE